jgi:hypothetical protein
LRDGGGNGPELLHQSHRYGDTAPSSATARAPRTRHRVHEVGGIFLRHGDSFVAMREKPYAAEELLQALIAEHPEVLAGDDEDDGDTGLILIKREAGVPDEGDAADRWSVDHLFIDQAGIPTLVEVKRRSDTRARREVVAQMLEYAANATAHWKVESLRAWFEAECERIEEDPVSKLDDAFAIADYDSYWETVKTNLAADRIRLVFVADEVSPELRSIVEFLNRQMTETEVLAIEVRQYVDEAGERQTIVPRIVGQTQAAKAAKRRTGGPARRWDEAAFFAALTDHRSSEAVANARSLIAWANGEDGVRIVYGGGAVHGSATARLEQDGRTILVSFRIYSTGSTEVPLRTLHSDEARAELRRRLYEAIPSISRGPVPTFDLGALSDERVLHDFLDAIGWSFDEARHAT